MDGYDLNEILQIVFSANALFPEFIDKKFLTDLYNRRINISDEKRAKMLYTVLCLEIWNKQVSKKSTPVLQAKQIYS